MRAQHSHGSSADFEYGIIDDALVIIDLNLGNKSVTNDAESVIKTIEGELQREGRFLPKIIVYRDSEGVFDGMDATNPDNIRFYPIQEWDAEVAVKKAKDKWAK